MNIDKPQCNLKTCRYCHDHNCFGQYETCEYTLAKNDRAHGEWIAQDEFDAYHKCSNCGIVIDNDFPIWRNYCPNCGADMREEGETEWTDLKS